MTERRSIDLGGITVDLLRIGTFWSDAGAIFGPVPQETWAPMVASELDARSRLLQALNILHVSDASGAVLWDLADAVPGETEHDVGIKLSGHELELGLRVEFADGKNESAAFLTVMPDAHEEQTAYAIGSGRIEETLRYEWHAH